MQYSDYIIYADESGSPNLDGIDPDYPVFVLAFVIIQKSVFAKEVVPAIQRLKFDIVGHDQIILHERDIRRQTNQFAFLRQDADIRLKFLESLNTLFGSIEISIVSAVIRKDDLREKYTNPWSRYAIALHLCLEKILSFLEAKGQGSRRVHVVFEGRGRTEDQELEIEFRRITNNDANWGYRTLDFRSLEWEPLFVSKRPTRLACNLQIWLRGQLGLRY